MPVDALSPITEAFHTASGQWFTVLFGYANWVFNILIVVELVSTMIFRLGSGDFFWAILMGRIFRLCFFKYVLVNANWLIPGLIDGFVYAGSTASGAIGDLNPQSIFMQGVFIAGTLNVKLSALSFWTQPFAILTGCFISFGIILAYLAIAAQLLLTLVETYIICGAGVFFLGMGGWSGTSDIAARYISYVVAVGTKLFLLYLIVGMGATLGNTWANMLLTSTLLDFNTLFSVLGGVAAFGLCAWRIPNLASSLLTGSLGMGLHDAIETTSVFTRVTGAALAGPPVAAGAAARTVGIGYQTAKANGGGVLGAVKGTMAIGGAVGRETAAMAVPRLSRGAGNLTRQHQELKGKS